MYLVIGLFYSFVMNVWAALTGRLSAFVWTGSLEDQALSLLFWFVIPALTWPIDLYWTLYHMLFH